MNPGLPRAGLVAGVIALVLLNAALSFENWWPSPAIKPDARLAPEFVAVWVLLLVLVRRRGTVSPRALAALATLYLLLFVGRYVDVTVPALFGRELNLYWDGPQLPRFLEVASRRLAWWQLAGIGAIVASVFVGLWLGLRRALAAAAAHAAPRALRSRAALAATAGAVALSLLNLAGVEATWPYVSKPVLPTYAKQADLLSTAWSPVRLARALPASPPVFDSDLAALGGVDVELVFLESYGAIAYDHPQARAALGPARADLAARIAASGRHVVSAFVRSPTFGGASDLAHLGLLSGLDLGDPVRHDLLLTTSRPTMLGLFRSRGYETVGLYPALSWPWPESAFYGFDHLLDGPALGYRGPKFGYWSIPDQFAIARYHEMMPLRADSPPRLLFFATINSHVPFRPVPPYQPDWSRITGEAPFDPADVERSLADRVDWLDLYPAYLRSIDYTYRWLSGYVERPRTRDALLILVGDHQPVAGVSGRGASWDVPVHVVSTDRRLLQRLVDQGFEPGIDPRRQPLGAMHELTTILLRAFDAAGPERGPQARVATGGG
jgi:hypothetical protein